MGDTWNRIRTLIGGLKDLTTLGTSYIVVSAIGGLFWFYIASLVGVKSYGEISYFVAIATVATTISSLGSGNTIIVYTAKGEKIQPPVFFVSIISGLITSVIVFIIFNNLGVSLYVIANLIFSLVIAERLGMKAYRDYSIYIVAQKILSVGLAVGLFFIMGSNGVILGLALSCIPFVIKLYGTFKGNRIDFALLRPKFGFMMNNFALGLSRIFSEYVDKLIIAPLFGFALLGNYQLGVQVLQVLVLLPSIVYQYIVPQDASGNPNKNLKKATVLMSVGLAIFGVLIAPKIIEVLFPKFTEAIGVIQIMSFAVIPISINFTYISKFLGMEKNRIVLIGSGIYVVVEVIAILVLGKLYGINGMATSIVLSATSESIYLININRMVSKITSKDI